MEVKEVFEAYPKNVDQFLGDKGAGFYIPVYQREYSWPPEMVSALLSDCLLGLEHLVGKSDSITFIGSTIVIKDNRHETIHPMAVGDLPNGVYLVIDGQQRITTIGLLATVLHSMISDFLKKIEKKTNLGEYKWVYDFGDALREDLKEVFLIDQRHPKDSPSLRYYPKIIRAQADCWSREKALAKYTSPIGSYLHQYIKHIFSKDINSFNYVPPTKEEKYLSIINNTKALKKDLEKIIEGGSEDYDFPRIADLVRSESIKEVLFNGRIPDEVSNLLQVDNPTKDEVLLRSCFRLITLANFIFKRIAITEVIVKNEDYAFDMFEALNTTGEPLTAFETFKPEVIRDETLKLWEESPSFHYVAEIEKLLNQFEKAEDKQRATSDLLIPFRLFNSGQKLTKKLNEQRKYLRKSYQELPAQNERRQFVGRSQ